jgi:hypothetical protein
MDSRKMQKRPYQLGKQSLNYHKKVVYVIKDSGSADFR